MIPVGVVVPVGDRLATPALRQGKNAGDMTQGQDRSVILVTGMSGTGKSAVLAALGRRGHRVIDTDDRGWIVNVQTPFGLEPMWDLGRVRELLNAHRSGWLFVAGCVANQRAVYDLFDAVVLLSAPIDVILARVLDRQNPFGSRLEERAKIADDVDEVEPLLRAGADHEIRTTAPIEEIITVLERVAAGPGRRAGRIR
jgi:shikimate kinase